MPVKEKGNTKPTIQLSNAEKHRQQAGKKEKRPKKWERKKMDPEVYLEKEDSIDGPLCNELANLSHKWWQHALIEKKLANKTNYKFIKYNL